jgi:hypothetical protein
VDKRVDWRIPVVQALAPMDLQKVPVGLQMWGVHMFNFEDARINHHQFLLCD